MIAHIHGHSLLTSVDKSPLTIDPGESRLRKACCKQQHQPKGSKGKTPQKNEKITTIWQGCHKYESKCKACNRDYCKYDMHYSTYI